MADTYVWAKWVHNSEVFWPGKICIPPKTEPEQEFRASKWIYFFGKMKYDWAEEADLKPYLIYRDAFVSKFKGNAHKKAIREIDQYMSNPEKYKANFIEFGQPTATSSEGIPENKVLRKPKRALNYAEEAVPVQKKPRNTHRDIPVKGKPKDKLNIISVKKEPIDTPIDVPVKRKPKDKLKGIKVKKEPLDTPADVPFKWKPKDKLKIISVKKEPMDTYNIDNHLSNGQVQSERIGTSSKILGFLGVGIIGSRIVKHLVDSGHKVIVWNPAPLESREEVRYKVAKTACDLVQQVDIIFACVSDPSASKELLFGNNGIISSNEHLNGKGYVEMACADVKTSQNTANAVVSKGGRYLELPIQGSINEAEERNLVLLGAGDHSLYNECQSYLNAIGKKSLFLGVVGKASFMHLIVQSMRAAMFVGLTEALSLGSLAVPTVPPSDVLNLLKETHMASAYLMEAGRAINSNERYQPQTDLQNYTRLALSQADQLNQAMPITAAVNQALKRARSVGVPQNDDAAN